MVEECIWKAAQLIVERIFDKEKYNDEEWNSLINSEYNKLKVMWFWELDA